MATGRHWCSATRCSHADVERRSNRWAQALLALGLQPGERVAVLLDNSVHSVDSVFGVEKAALTYVALNARHTLAEHLDVLADAEPARCLVGPAFASLAQAFADPATTACRAAPCAGPRPGRRA
jgi:acyl-CoA synthetase (AMP-forming)/AMP-acid ligase II